MRYIAFLFLFFQFAGAQDRTIYLNDNLMPVAKESHTYYRVIKDYDKELPSYTVQLFYKTGKLKQEVTSTNRDLEKFEGQLLAYYDNTQIEKTEMYRDGRKDGICRAWYPDGSKKLEGFYTNDGKLELLHVMKYWDKNKTMTVSEGNGICEFEDDNIVERGPIKNGLRDGSWTGKHMGPEYSFSETYKDGIFNGGVSTPIAGNNILYDQIEIKTEPKDGLAKFYTNFDKEFKIPARNTIEGRIFLTFIVTKEGSIEDIKVYKGLSPELDAEAIRVLSKCDKWKPALQRGIPVRCRYTLPVSIKKPQ